MLTPKELKATFQTLKSVSISLFYLFWHPPSDTVHRGDSELLSICGGRAVLERVWSVMVELAFKNYSLFQSLTSTGWKLCSPPCCLPSCDPSFCLSPGQRHSSRNAASLCLYSEPFPFMQSMGKSCSGPDPILLGPTSRID